MRKLTGHRSTSQLNFVRIFSQGLELKDSVKYSSRFHTSLSVVLMFSHPPKPQQRAVIQPFYSKEWSWKGRVFRSWPSGNAMVITLNSTLRLYLFLVCLVIISMKTCSCSQSQRCKSCAIRHLELGHKIVLYCEIQLTDKSHNFSNSFLKMPTHVCLY